MIDDMQAIRSRHATAMTNRKRGTFDSRDDDIGLLLREVDRLKALCREAYESENYYWKVCNDRHADSDKQTADAHERRHKATLAVYREGGMK